MKKQKDSVKKNSSGVGSLPDNISGPAQVGLRPAPYGRFIFNVRHEPQLRFRLGFAVLQSKKCGADRRPQLRVEPFGRRYY
jgi:hypothetical protein